MKNIYALTAILLAASATASNAADVGVSVSIGQPGFYGQIDIGDFPPPRVIYREPRLIERDYVGAPVYMRVPPGHAKHWDKHCHEYHACNRQVYFVQDDWYTREYVPRYQERHHNDRDDYRDHGKDDRDDHGHGKGKGKNH